MKKNHNDCQDSLEAKPCCACSQVNQELVTDDKRRNLLKYLLLSIPVVNYFSTKTAFAAMTKKSAESKLPPQIGDRFTYFSKHLRGPIITPADLEGAEKQLLVVPVDANTGEVRDGSRYNQILLQKLPMESLSTKTQGISAQGIVAYSAICTHAGCPVTGWVKEDKNYMCPCHQSVFDPNDMGSVVAGPAPRKLPALGLAVDNNELVVAAEFNSWIGFGKPRR
jgi:rieske iron-sulfur protein